MSDIVTPYNLNEVLPLLPLLQVATQRGFPELACLLRPRADLAAMFPDVQRRGPPTLREIAVDAARSVLQGQLAALRQHGAERDGEEREEGEEERQAYSTPPPMSAPLPGLAGPGVFGLGPILEEPQRHGARLAPLPGALPRLRRLSDPGTVQPSPPSCCSSDDAHTCGVCLDAPVAVAPSGCCHGLCHDCAARMVAGIKRDLPGCPFCRAPIKAWRLAD